MSYQTLEYTIDGRIARITLNRPERGNGITMDMPRELAECVEQANIDRRVHVIALSGNGSGFCGGSFCGSGFFGSLGSGLFVILLLLALKDFLAPRFPGCLAF